MREYMKYANQVTKLIPADRKTKFRIREDIINQLEDMGGDQGIDPYEEMGLPATVAAEFIENLDINSKNYRIGYEYKSSIEILGVPLVHVTSNYEVAKGIIAVGPMAVGVVAAGGASIGILSFGGLAVAGLLGFGGLALSAGYAIGGLAIGYLGAMGGLAVSKMLAIGGMAVASDVAVGDVAYGSVCGYKTSFEGDVGINLLENKDALVPAIKEKFPSFSKWMLDMIDAVAGTISKN